MKVEHFIPQSAVEDEARPARALQLGERMQLAWTNLLGACPGGAGSPRITQHCDTRKGDERISLDPTNGACTSKVRYATDGSVFSDDAVTDRELKEVLQLNVAYLQKGRQVAITVLAQQVGPGKWSETQIRRHLRSLQPDGETTQLIEYAPVLVYWLEKRLGLR